MFVPPPPASSSSSSSSSRLHHQHGRHHHGTNHEGGAKNLKLKFIVLGFIFTVSTLYAIQYRCFEEENYVYSLPTNFGEQVPNDANAFASNLPISDEDDFGEREEEGATTTTSGGEEDEDEDDEKEPIRRSSSSSNDDSVNYNLPGADASMPCGGQPREMLPLERERRLRRKMLGDAWVRMMMKLRAGIYQKTIFIETRHRR